MTVSIHGTLILGLGDNARLRTEIGELSVAREAFAGIPTKATSLFAGCASRRQPGTATCWCCRGRTSRITSSGAPKHAARRPTRGRTQRPSPSPGRRLREGRPAFIVRHRRLPAAGSEARRPFVRPVRARGSLRFEHPVKANRQVIPEG